MALAALMVNKSGSPGPAPTKVQDPIARGVDVISEVCFMAWLPNQLVQFGLNLAPIIGIRLGLFSLGDGYPAWRSGELCVELDHV